MVVIEFEGITLDVEKQTASVGKKVIRLDRVETVVLMRLLAARGRPVSSEELAISAFPARVDSLTPATYISRLRRKLGPSRIATTTLVGYYIQEAP